MPSYKILLLLILMILTACGGGGGGLPATTPTTTTPTTTTPTTSTPTTTPSQTPIFGVFSDSPVSGLRYQTATQSGLTDSNGTFQYLPGENITFSIGGFDIGTVQASELITPFSLAGISEPPTSQEYIAQALARPHDPIQTLLNITILLQTLDYDGDPTNQIEITSEISGNFAQDLSDNLDITIEHYKFRNNENLVAIINNLSFLNLFNEDTSITPRLLKNSISCNETPL